MAREAARAQREADAAHRRAVREIERQTRRRELEARQATRDAKAAHVEAQLELANDRNIELTRRKTELAGILAHTLDVDDAIDFGDLMLNDDFPVFADSEWGREFSSRPDPTREIASLPLPSFVGRLFGAEKRYRARIQKIRVEFEQKAATWEGQLAAARAKWERGKADFELKKSQRNAEVQDFMYRYIDAEPQAVCAYASIVLERSEYPDGFPQAFELAYAPSSKQLVVEYELPNVSSIPAIAEHKYVKVRDEIQAKPAKPSEVAALYRSVVSAIALRTMHELFESDVKNHIDVVCFNGLVATVDNATGKDIRPHLISVRAAKEGFLSLDLARVDPQACLRNLGAQVSPSPAEAIPVKPVVEFNMVDPRFVGQTDVLNDLESRPNLMDLNPYEFEALIANLFGKMGLESKLTRSSRDGGVDCVAFDKRPVFGGKVVIQAKRYKNVVGVAAVRDLYGTMINEGANKGILVTTSDYGPDAFGFSSNKPIELINGGGLLYLLEQIGYRARIVAAN